MEEIKKQTKEANKILIMLAFLAYGIILKLYGYKTIN